MKTPLLTTQLEDIEQMMGSYDLPNFSEPGTGKTLTTTGAIERSKLQTGLIVCPLIATTMWKETLEDELGARVQLLKKKSDEIDKLADFMVMSYGLITAFLPDLLERNNDALVVDESHYCRHRTSERTKAVFGLDCNGAGGLYETSLQCWLLTGTPIERYADDLWSQLRATQPDVLAKYKALTFDHFLLQFCYTDDRAYNENMDPKRVVLRNINEHLLNKMLYQEIGCIRRYLSEISAHIPFPTSRDISVAIKATPELKEAYKHIKDETDEELMQKMIDGDIAMSTLLRLLGKCKVEPTIDYIMDWVSKKQLLVGYWHKEVGADLTNGLQANGIVTERIGGDTSQSSRAHIKEHFIKGDIQVLVGQIGAMGVAMDGLQKATDHVIIVQDNWSPGVIEQFYRRIARLGQKEQHVQVDFIRDTVIPIDEAIKKIRLSRMETTSKIMERTGITGN